MFIRNAYTATRDENYRLLLSQLTQFIENETNQIANLSNASALLNQFLEEINWVGFYLNDGNELVLGPFQGLPACIRIPFGKGVCGTAAIKQQTIVVADVHQYPGHIACDAASNSEIVIPLLKNNRLIGVLDIDSPQKGRFDETDKQYLEQFCRTLTAYL